MFKFLTISPFKYSRIFPFKFLNLRIFKCSFLLLLAALGCLAPLSSHASAFNLTRSANSLGLVGYWTFDGKDLLTGLALDRSGQGNNGALVAMSTSTSRVQGKLGQALNFDGVNDYINYSVNAYGLGIRRSGTFSGWLKPRDFNSDCFILSDWNATAGMTLRMDLGGTKATFYVYPNNHRINPSYTFAIGKWYHLVGVMDGDTIYLYANGVSIGSTTLGEDIGNSVSTLKIAQRGDLGGSYSTCIFDDVRIYNRALSATEISQLYNSTQAKFNAPDPSPGSLTSGLVGYWTFDGKDLLTGLALDRSGQGNNGNLVSMSTSTSRVQGKLGQALNFDGTNDYISFPGNSAITNPTAITLSAWFKASKVGVEQRIINLHQRYRLELSSTNKIYCAFTTVNQAWSFCTTLGSTTLVANKWYHAAVTYDGISTYTYYLNGIADNTNSSQYTGSITGGQNQPCIGYGCDLASHYFNGLIDDARIYNRALSASEISHLYSLGR